MNRIKIIVFILLATCIGMSNAFAQDVSTQGTEFWVSFLGNGYRNHPDQGSWILTQVLISGKRDCQGTVENPNTGWSFSFRVRANNITSIDIPTEQAYLETSEIDQPFNKALRITTEDTVSVFCTNIAHVSFDASYVLPTQALADDYLIQCYDQSTYFGYTTTIAPYLTSAFLIIATEDNTIIDITPKTSSYNDIHPANETFTITLNAGEVYQFRSTQNGNARDLSGSRVTARDCKRIAVFNGNTLTAIPDSRTSRDHVFEQAMPLRSWGKKFAVTGSYGRNDDYVKITSSANNNPILKNGELLTTLRAGESYIFTLHSYEESCFIESSYPVAVFLYNTSYDNYDESGDPSMVWIAPIEQRIDEMTFTTFNDNNVEIDNHYVNIIVNSEDIGLVYLDNQQLSPLLFSPINGNADYSYIRKEISHNVHHLTCANGFNAHVYGFGHAKGYAYLVGSKASNLTTSLTINDVEIQANDVFQYCIDQPVTFSAEINIQAYNLLWDFGDGTTSTLNPVSHTYHDKQVFQASLVVDTDDTGCLTADSDTLIFFIDATQQYIIESDEICAGELYSGHGFNNVFIQNDTILGRLQDNALHPECQDSLLVYITARPQYHVPINDSRCWQGEPGIYNSHGFSFEYGQPGEYDRQLNLESINGCDSIVILHLTVADRITHEFNHHECSNSFIWDGEAFTQSGDYERFYTSAGGCDSIVTLHLTMGHPQYSTFDTITCGVFVWNGQEYNTSGTYRQTFTTYDGCDSIVDYTLHLSGAVEGDTISASTCDSYHWLGTDYTETGLYSKALSSVLGCDSIVHLNLDVNYTPKPTAIFPKDPDNEAPHWVITATEFQINTYEFTVWDTNFICQWDSVKWHFEDPELHWVLDPDTANNSKYCKMYVLEYVEDTVWLDATIYNPCAPEGVTRRYWFVCSFYGIEDYHPSTGTGTFGFSVIPNPNNGSMNLNFEYPIGKVDIKVYDMTGNLIDHFETNNNEGSASLPYDMKRKNDGIYFFVATSKEGSVARKVIVTH